MTPELAEEVHLQAEDHAQNVVQEDKLAHQDLPETTENQEMLELLEALEAPVNQPSRSANKQLHHHATHAQLDHPDHQELQEHQVMPVQMETQDKAVEIHNQAHLDLRDHLDLLEALANLEPLVTQAKTPNRKTVEPEPQDQLGMPDRQDHPDQLVNQDNQADQDNLDQKAPTETPDPLETMDSPDTQERRELQAVLVRRVFARNTAPSMVEFSSKTALAAVKLAPTRLADLPTSICPMNTLLLVAQKTAIYYVSLYCGVVGFPLRWLSPQSSFLK
jgi:hypothetical protein